MADAVLASIALRVGIGRAWPDPSARARAIDRVRALTREVGLPARLSEAGVQEQDLESIADLAFRDASHQGNPRATTREDLLAIARNAY